MKLLKLFVLLMIINKSLAAQQLELVSYIFASC